MLTNEHDIHRQRLALLVIITEVPILGIGIKALLEGLPRDGIILGVLAVALLIVPLLSAKQKHEMASYVFILFLTAATLLLHWTSGGIKDNAILVLPGILIYAALLGVDRIYIPLLVLMACNLLLMGYLSDQGMEFNPRSDGLSSAVNVTLVLIIIGITVRILTRDKINLLARLNMQVKEVHLANEKMEYQALHDPLTQLANRKLAEQYFEGIQQRLSRKVIDTAGVIYVDFDEFKDINDTLGHAYGDQFLTEKAQTLINCTRKNDRVCRIGGDEFLIMVEGLDAMQMALFAQKLLDQAMTEVTVKGHKLNCTCSIGIVLLPKDANNYEDAVKRADIAMYRSKKQGKNRYQFYSDELEAVVQRRYRLQSQMMSAVLDSQFRIVLQPIVELTTRRIIGAEALARWEHPELGLIGPDEFIPLAESNGVIDELCAFVMYEALDAVKNLRTVIPDFYISVNIAPTQLKSLDFFNKCQQIIGQSPVPTSALKLEITESDIIERDRVFDENILHIHQNQIGLLLDDFGTGYSNLAHLQKMNFESIKVDRQFITACHLNDETRTLLRSIVAMARELDIDLIAEGIEIEAELNEILNLGIRKGQGYLFARPVEVAELLDHVRESPAL